MNIRKINRMKERERERKKRKNESIRYNNVLKNIEW